MNRTMIKFMAPVVLVGVLFLSVPVAYANTPTLSVYPSGNSDSVTLSVYGDPYANVSLYYQTGYSGMQSLSLGTTSSGGYLSTALSSSSLGVSVGSSVYIMINGQTSPGVAWPYSSGYNNYGALSLSQSSISVSSGQSASVTIYGGNAPYTMSANSSNIFQTVIGGNTIQISGLSAGSGSVNICSNGGNGCAVLYVIVNGGYYQPNYNLNQSVVTFSQTSPTLYAGQSLTVNISGGNSYNYYYGNNYNIAYNSNSSLVSANISGNSLVLQGLASGTASVVVCSNSTSCSAINLTIGGGSYNNNYGNWTQCANEGGYCSFSGTQNVRYGANGVYVYKLMSGGVYCSNNTFGDPIFGVAKQCSIGGY